MRPTLALLLVAFALAVTPATARVKVKVAHDPQANFTTLKTWAWPDDGPGQVKMALTKDDDPETIRKRFEPVILASVERELSARKLAKAAPGQAPDFLVAYFALINLNTSAQTLGQFLPGTVAWGLPPFEAVTTSLKIYEQGSLVLDVMTPARQPMWRGIAQAELHRDRPDAQRDKALGEAVRDLLKRFPPKK